MTTAEATPTKALAPIDDVRRNIEIMAPQFKMALPPQVKVEKFVRVTMTAVQSNPDLLSADRHSLYGACMKAAQDGLLIDGREATIQIYNTNVGTKDNPRWAKMAQYMPMVEGLLKKVRNSGEIANVSVQVVKENDHFEYELGDNERIVHRPALAARGKTIGAYSIVTLKNGEKSREWMDAGQIEEVRTRSKSKDKGPWVTDFDEMARKTVFRRHYKRLPKSTDRDDIDRVLQHDNETFDMEAEREVGPKATAPAAVSAPATDNVKPARPRRLQGVVDRAKGNGGSPEQQPQRAPGDEPPAPETGDPGPTTAEII